MFARAPNVVSIVTDAPPGGVHPRGEPILCSAGVDLAVTVGAFHHRGAHLGGGLGDLAECPPQEVDGVGTPGTDPTAAAGGVEEPPVPAQRDARDGRERAPLHVLDRADRAVLHEGAQRGAAWVVAELEVQERERTGIASGGLHRDGFVGVASEGLVAQHGVPCLECPGHVVAVQERWRVHRDQLDVGMRAQRPHRGFVARRDHVDDVAAVGLGEHWRHDPPTEAAPDHADPEG